MGKSQSKETQNIDTSSDEGFTEALSVHLHRLVTYAQGSNPVLQREVAERLANEAVKRMLSVFRYPDEFMTLL